MLILLALVLAADADVDRARLVATCEVGRVAIRDLPTDVDAGRYALGYGFPSPRGRDLLDDCPELARELPADMPLADAETRRRAGVHAPIRGEATPLTKVFNIGTPQFSADLKAADIPISYECTGMCGLGFVAQYARTRAGWVRVGTRDRWVS